MQKHSSLSFFNKFNLYIVQDWSKPQRQSGFGILMFAGKAFREVVAILLITTGSIIRQKKSALAWFALYGLTALYVFGKAFLEYYFFSFYISGDQLIVKKGIFAKKTLVIPLERIQTVQLHQNLLHKIIGHCKLKIDTAGTEKTEVDIQSLTYKNAISLKAALTKEITETATSTVDNNRSTIRLATPDLFKLAVSANHLETFGLIVAFALARFQDVKDLLGIDVYDYAETQGKAVTFTAQSIGIIVFFVLAFSILISVVRIILRFSDLTIQMTDKGFHLKHGLLNSQQQFIGARKIQFVLWKANWIRRKIGMYMFHVKTAGEEDLKRKQRIHVPVTREAHLKMLCEYYQPQLPSASNEVNTIQPQYIFRRILLIGLPVFLFFTGITFIWWKWYSLWFGLWLVYFVIRTIIYQRNFKIWVDENALELSRGVWGREKLILNWQKLQSVTIQQSIYQRRNGFASLALKTASGPVNIPYLKSDEARILADYAAMKTESSQQNWM